MDKRFVAIVDYDLGNLFSVKQACKKSGLEAVITSCPDKIKDSSAVILTGVGAFAKAMEILTDKGLVSVLRDCALSGKPIMGICLGMQILMTESYEFGRYKGLDIIKGEVKKLEVTKQGQRILKVPHIGWSSISPWPLRQAYGESALAGSWQEGLFQGIPFSAQVYFVHSYFVQPQDENVILSKTVYGTNDFCSSIQYNNIFAVQFHPECSGSMDLKIYENLAKRILGNSSRRSYG